MHLNFGACIVAAGSSLQFCLLSTAYVPRLDSVVASGRRALFCATGAAAAAGGVGLGLEGRASAFANRLPDPEGQKRKKKALFSEENVVDLRPPFKAGIDTRADYLKACDYTTNCLSSVAPKRNGYLEPWKFSGKASGTDAMREIEAAVRAYPVGQRTVDGGGFEVKEVDDDYVYTQFESRKYGYIDDVEFVLDTPRKNGDGKVLVRSTSRVGDKDYGVNAVRLNRLAADLRAKGGWDAPPITRQSSPRYWDKNCEASGNNWEECNS